MIRALFSRANAVALAALFGAADATVADEARMRNWPAWRGPLANGTAPHADPPIEWSETANVKWKVPLPGRGTSTPVVWDQQVFILSAVPAGRKAEPNPAAAPGAAPAGPRRGMVTEASPAQQFTVSAFDRATGKLRWQHIAREQLPHAGHHRDHGYASGSPVTDGQHLLAYFGSYGLYAYDLAGKLIWEKDLGDQQTRNSFGEGTSPALHGNTVVILWDHEGEDFIVALDKRDGRELWRQERDEPTGWCTPLIVEHEGHAQVVVNGTNRARAYDLSTGRLLWESGGQTANAIPSPVSGHGLVYVTSGFRGSALQAIRLGSTGALEGTGAIAWSHSKNTPYVPSPLLYDDLLYLYSGNTAMLSIFDARSGTVHLNAERIEGVQDVYASPTGANGRVYLIGRHGDAVVLKKSPQLEILARNKLEDGFDASPALVGTDLILRGRENLYCLAAAEPRAGRPSPEGRAQVHGLAEARSSD